MKNKLFSTIPNNYLFIFIIILLPSVKKAYNFNNEKPENIPKKIPFHFSNIDLQLILRIIRNDWLYVRLVGTRFRIERYVPVLFMYITFRLVVVCCVISCKWFSINVLAVCLFEDKRKKTLLLHVLLAGWPACFLYPIIITNKSK